MNRETLLDLQWSPVAGVVVMKHWISRARLFAPVAIIALVAGIGLAQFTPATPAVAATASTFYPGNIISEEKFHDASTMTSDQVQSFLEMQVSRCATGATCLKDYRQTTWTRAADAQCSSYTAGTNERASLIISKVARACGINPQVLLVLLQKEQSLVSSTAPSAAKYAKATGYACPDTAPCDAQFSGFYNQVYKAAWQFKYYENHPNSYRYKKNTVTSVQLHPNAACGTQSVYIENQATANLYIYTPYVPNAAALANLYGTGDGCSAYGNRNFWRMFTDWFGSTTGPKTTHGAVDATVGIACGIQLSGWAVDPYKKGSTSVWVDIDGKGQSVAANLSLNWIEKLYPGYGKNHGFDTVLGASAGSHRVCVSQANGTSLGCSTVTVPRSDLATGYVDSVTSAAGGVRVTGWAVDKTTSAPTFVWINVDGKGGPYRATVNLPWTASAYPGTGSMHGFDVAIPTTPGTHKVCVSGSQALLGCESVTVANNEVGVIESATGVVGGVNLAGYSLDQRSTAATYVWATIDGKGKPVKANGASASGAAAYPAAGSNHGYSTFLAASPGTHTVCVTGTSENTSYGCKTVKVPPNEVGFFDSAKPVYGGIDVSGWSLDQTSTKRTYVWVTVDGKNGTPLAAKETRGWIAGAYPKSGSNHGFSGQLAASPGKHEVCITGTQENVSYGCKTVTVPNREVGFFDSAKGVFGGIDVAGWSLDRTANKRTYVWATVDGKNGTPLAAKNPLAWVGGLYPGVGSNHGFSGQLAASPGKHEVCITGTQENVPYGCKTVTVPNREVGFFDSAKGVFGGIDISGWSLDQTSDARSYVWVTVDGKNGTPVAAKNTLGWIPGLYPASGANHGFSSTIKASAGSHRICVSGTQENVSYGCKTVVVPQRYPASIDSLTGVSGGVKLSGWAVDVTSTAAQYLWVDIDGTGSAVKAGGALPWINAYFPGVGANHGFSTVVKATPGSHRVCLTLTSDNRSLGCSTVVTP